MDFLFFFVGYLGLFAVVAVFVLFANSTPFLSAVSEKIKRLFFKGVHSFVPTILVRSTTRLIHYVFHTRNHVMQVVFGALVMGGNIILMLDILPLLYIFEPDQNHILLPLVLMFSNAVAFHFSCASDPGCITPANAAILASLYKADGVMYKTGVECRTCRFVKPPRSKHCSICNRCIHRFDHHCIWTNNCVGAGNLRFFLVFLISLMMMVINGAIMGVQAMILMVHHLKLMDSGYVDPQTGKVLPVTVAVLIQHLFMQHPRCIFLVTSLIMLTLLLGLFTLYHLYLVLNNQTTNERYKMAALPINNNHNHCSSNSNVITLKHQSEQQTSYARGEITVEEESGPQARHTHQGQSHQGKQCLSDVKSYLSSKNNLKKVTKTEVSNRNSIFGVGKSKKVEPVSSNIGGLFYDKGVLRNLREVFLPWADLHSIKQSKTDTSGLVAGPKKVKKR